MNEKELPAHIEALLYALGRPLSRTELVNMLGIDALALEAGINTLKGAESRGAILVDDGKTLELRVAPASAEIIERIRKEEYSREVGKAGLEALAAVLYRGPLSRSEIDFIRGVNSSQTLRTLLMRGLLRRVPNPKDERSYLFEPTTELLSTLGLQDKDELPDYTSIREKLAQLEQAYRETEDARQNEPA